MKSMGGILVIALINAVLWYGGMLGILAAIVSFVVTVGAGPSAIRAFLPWELGVACASACAMYASVLVARKYA